MGRKWGYEAGSRILKDSGAGQQLNPMVHLIREISQFACLAGKWNHLAACFATPLVRHEWFLACAQAVCPPAELCVLVLQSAGGLDAATALAINNHEGRETVEVLGSSLLCEPSGFIYRDEGSLRQLVGAIRDLNRPVLFRRLAADSPELRALAEVSRGRGFFTVRSAAGTPWLPIASPWCEFERGLSSRRKYDLGRARRRAEVFGKLEFEVLAPEPACLDECLKETITVEAAGWKGEAGTAMLCDQRVRSFFQHYTHTAALLGMLRFCSLRIDGRQAAFQIVVEHSNRLWVLKIGYDEAFARCSPGVLLMHETIRYAFDRGLEAFEFLGAEEPWIRMWTGQSHACMSAWLYPQSLRGLVHMGKDASRSMIRRITTMQQTRERGGRLPSASAREME